jgi:hypothetical protein
VIIAVHIGRVPRTRNSACTAVLASESSDARAKARARNAILKE